MRGDGCGIQSQKNRAKARPLQIQGSHYNSYGRFETPNASDKGPVLRQKASVKAKVLLPIQIGEEGGVDFDALPEIAEAKIFIGGVLMIIVVDDGNADPGKAEIFEDVHGDAAAEHRGNDGLIIGSVLHDADKRF